MSAPASLEVSGLTVAYGSVPALTGVSFAAAAGSITTIIGANGAGKTTLLKAIAGLLHPSAGAIRFAGAALAGLEADEVVGRGLALVPEGRRLFGSMTVGENLELGAYRRRDAAAIAADLERVLGYFPALRERLGARALTLSGGQQQMLAIGRALMAAPRFLMLDEPSIGLAPIVVDAIADILRTINAAGTGVLLVEQNAALALELAQHAVILENGRVTLAGPAAALARTDEVRSAYLGL